jgi:hypothetical protein
MCLFLLLLTTSSMSPLSRQAAMAELLGEDDQEGAVASAAVQCVDALRLLLQLCLEPATAPGTGAEADEAADATSAGSAGAAGAAGRGEVASLVLAEALPHVLAAMARFKDHALVQEKATKLIAHLATDAGHGTSGGGGGSGGGGLGLRLVELGAHEAVLGAMASHPRSAPVQAKGCGALRNLAGGRDDLSRMGEEGGAGAECRDALVEGNALPLLGRALRGHPRSGLVQEHGLAALRNLAALSTAARSALLEDGSAQGTEVCRLARAAMERFPRSGPVQAHGKALCAALGSTPSGSVGM